PENTEMAEIVMPAVADLSAIALAHESLQQGLQRTRIEMDAAIVERISTAYIQLLLAAHAAAQLAGKEMRIIRSSEALQNAFATLGLHESYKEMTSHA
ncbi:MAG: STAS domain-containing protein, partial [Rickettsiales bacterium]|nr:STAS domain-containing protein [Rickettsiales bacterium]